ncbi:MAG: pyruvoyl-dependent arginine decarboxylase, partial [archaeon]
MSTAYSEVNSENVSGIGIAINNESYGYAMEAQSKTKKETEKKLLDQLEEMAKIRNQKIIKTQLLTQETKTTKKFGCAITAVVYLF